MKSFQACQGVTNVILLLIDILVSLKIVLINTYRSYRLASFFASPVIGSLTLFSIPLLEAITFCVYSV